MILDKKQLFAIGLSMVSMCSLLGGKKRLSITGM